MNKLAFREFYRRRLPHIQVPGATYFITFRLAFSLPADILEKLSLESQRIEHSIAKISDKQERYRQADLEHRRLFGKLDEYLHTTTYGDFFFKDERIAALVSEALHFRDGKVYELLVFCIMPNHVHLVCTPLEKAESVCYGLGEILHSLKGRTARQANLILSRSGTFWQDESYDHIVRDDAELERIVKYVVYNPVKAGLVDDWKEWKWTYCQYDL